MVTILHSREEFVQLVVLSHAEGVGIRALARRFGSSRNTIRNILRKHQARRDEGPDGLAPQRKGLPKKSKLDPFGPQIAKIIEEFPDITGQRLFEMLNESGYDGGISILREHLKRLRPKPKREPIVRFETEPGEQGQMDWSLYRIPFTRTGKSPVLCFSYILGYSRRQYIDFTLHRDFFTLIRRHVDAFQHFGGVPTRVAFMTAKRPSCCAGRPASPSSIRPLSPSSPIISVNPSPAGEEGPKPRARSNGPFNTWRRISSTGGNFKITKT
jgi:transposase